MLEYTSTGSDLAEALIVSFGILSTNEWKIWWYINTVMNYLENHGCSGDVAQM